MDIQLEKQELMKLLQETQDFAILKKVRKIFQKEKKDWWDELSEEQKEMLEISLKQADNGEFHDFKEFITPYL